MLKNAPMFKRIDPKMKVSSDERALSECTVHNAQRLSIADAGRVDVLKHQCARQSHQASSLRLVKSVLFEHIGI